MDRLARYVLWLLCEREAMLRYVTGAISPCRADLTGIKLLEDVSKFFF